jgi:Ca2+/Na+ antiporter
MSDKVKKQASSLSFTLSKWFQRISTMKPSTFIVSTVVIGAVIFLFAGGLYDIIVQPLVAYYNGQRFYFLYPDISSQFVFDTVVAATLYVVGFVGLMAIYQSSKHAYNSRQAYMTMIIGVTLLAIAYIFIEYFVHMKLAGV